MTSWINIFFFKTERKKVKQITGSQAYLQSKQFFMSNLAFTQKVLIFFRTNFFNTVF